MKGFINGKPGDSVMLMGNEAIARGALEAGVTVAAAYPGTPSSEILENLSKAAGKIDGLIVEWSANEKVAMEVAAAGSFAGLRSMTSMKQCGINVAADFLTHLSYSGTRGGMVMVSCDDPGGLSSINEEESRAYAQHTEIPLLEPSDVQEAKDMMKYAFELSEHIHNIVMIRSLTRLSHASGPVTLGEILDAGKNAEFKFDGPPLDPDTGIITTVPMVLKHSQMQQKLEKAVEWFEQSPFNAYEGPAAPELLIVTSSVCYLYSKEALHQLELSDRVGILKLGTTWPLPPKLIEKYLRMSDRILVVEETLPLMEEGLKVLAMELAPDIGIKRFHGKRDNLLPSVGELNPSIVARGLAKIMEMAYELESPDAYVAQAQKVATEKLPVRDLVFCPGCPHRASLWSLRHALKLDGRDGFGVADIGCYIMDILPGNYGTCKSIHCMGSGIGVASGFSKLSKFGMKQPVVTTCGDSTFFHSALPGLANAIHHNANLTMLVLDNSGTAMTGFQPHPGLNKDAEGEMAIPIDIESVCRAMGARVEICDPFDVARTQQIMLDMIDGTDGVNVLILKQICALSPEKKAEKKNMMQVNEEACLGDACGCSRLCTRMFRCPALIWDLEKEKARVDEGNCIGCGVCASVCPQNAIRVKEEV
ncbi:indolepyruvate ferredoxin oxidoreductase alpha subunit [Desulfocicer vacuolatum DSM 3385]|uniref:Indolepyruvate oxidoreductase subunit IorA n=1 Tax=Desulfocicer vacuolatum DSM 3385 TaxID=1121400 RepID=A0A1W2EPV8_9BACT|nr:indolepyruvate ferredoxin oxidoreductase subunit alpha [Desulfocicer vacuolatum]SMD11720.1 indolepyruvate ferredoxin oxidoreductase alpha subunit [Desulfocicer vacuolatum DSM 3385]